MSKRSKAGLIIIKSYEPSASFPITSINFPVIIRYLVGDISASSKTVLEILECSRSESIVVKTASEDIPLNNQSPPTPEPVPISTTAFALTRLTANFKKFPTAAVGSAAPIS